MLMGTRRLFAPLILISTLTSGSTQAQQACEQITEAMRGQSNVGTTDQRAIEACLREQLQTAALLPSARMKTVVANLRAHRDHPANSAAFLNSLRAGAAAVAETELARRDLDPMVAAGLARGLFDLGGTDSIPAWLVGLKSHIEAIRYLSARALASKHMQVAIRVPRGLPARVAAALGQAGQAEQSAAVRSQVYRALALLPFSTEVFDAYLAMMDKSLDRLRGGAVRIAGAELPAYRQLASQTLNSDQRVQLVARLGPLLGRAAARYKVPDVGHEEAEVVERCLYFIDEALSAIVSGGGTIRKVMNEAGGASAVEQEVVRWIGDADAGTTGALNNPPHNLPLGAP